MAIYRGQRPGASFTIVSNAVLRDDRLSYRARGILAVILSHQEDWSTSSEALARAGREGRDAVRTALQELEAAGYLMREKRRGADGRFATQQVVYDEPQAIQGELFPGPAPENPTPVEPPSGGPSSIEDHQEDNLPTGGSGGKPKLPATLVAEAHYEHVSGMCNFLAIRGIATRALKVKGTTVESVTVAMNALYDAGRPITFQTVGQQLGRSAPRDTNNEHWASGGQFQ